MVQQSEAEKQLPLVWKLFLSGLAACTAECATIPFDTIKVVMQVFQGKYSGMVECGQSLVKQYGFPKLYAGLTAGLQRQMIFAPLRLTLFPIFTDKIAEMRGHKVESMLDKILGGLLSGAIGISVANPTDVVKVRFQGDIKASLSGSGAPRYKGVVDAYSTILAKEGLGAFWTGIIPNILRNSVINAAEVVTFYQAKEFLTKNNILKEGYANFFVSSAVAGIVAVLFGSPFDVTKSRMMNGKEGTGIKYSGISECVADVFKTKGILGFYAGVKSNAIRLISWNIMMFMCREKYYAEMAKYYPKKQ